MKIGWLSFFAIEYIQTRLHIPAAVIHLTMKRNINACIFTTRILSRLYHERKKLIETQLSILPLLIVELMQLPCHESDCESHLNPKRLAGCIAFFFSRLLEAFEGELLNKLWTGVKPPFMCS